MKGSRWPVILLHVPYQYTIFYQNEYEGFLSQLCQIWEWNSSVLCCKDFYEWMESILLSISELKTLISDIFLCVLCGTNILIRRWPAAVFVCLSWGLGQFSFHLYSLRHEVRIWCTTQSFSVIKLNSDKPMMSTMATKFLLFNKIPLLNW